MGGVGVGARAGVRARYGQAGRGGGQGGGEGGEEGRGVARTTFHSLEAPAGLPSVALVLPPLRRAAAPRATSRPLDAAAMSAKRR